METIEIKEVGFRNNGARYRVWHNGRVLIESCRVPMCDAARVLLRDGFEGRMSLRRFGSGVVDATGDIALLAGRTISESMQRGPRKAIFREFSMEVDDE